MNKNWIYLIPLTLLIIGCGTTTEDSTPDGEGSIDLRSYLEQESVTKNYKLVNKEVGQTLINQYYTEESTVTADKIERVIEGITDTIVTIEDKKIIDIDVSDEGNIQTSYYRYVDVGDTLFSTDINKTKTLTVGTQEIGKQQEVGSTNCKLIEQLNEFTQDSNAYTGDILKIKCTTNTTITTKVKDEFIGSVKYINGTEDSIDVSYHYHKKNTGLIALIDDNCIPVNMTYPDDTIECSDENKSYTHIYYLGN